MRAFDFDKTIYNGYSFSEFCFYSSFRRPWTAFYSLFITVPSCLLKALRLISTKKLVEIASWPYIGYKRMHKHIESFWNSHKKKINSWFFENLSDTDIIISASFDFFLEIPSKMLGIKTVIGSRWDYEKRKIINPYCYKEGKWERFCEIYGEDAVISEYYTDSHRDGCMLEKAQSGFIVKKGNFTKIK